MKKYLVWEEFEQKYKPIKNHIQKDASYDGCMFETYGEEVKYVCDLINNEQKLNHVWTILDTGFEETWIFPGYFLCDRIGYLITEKPWKDDNIQVNDNEMCTIEEAINHCISFGEMQFNVGFDKNDVSQHFNENLDPTFEGEMTIGRAKYIAIDYFEDRLEKNIDEFENELHNYYSQLK